MWGRVVVVLASPDLLVVVLSPYLRDHPVEVRISFGSLNKVR